MAVTYVSLAIILVFGWLPSNGSSMILNRSLWGSTLESEAIMECFIDTLPSATISTSGPTPKPTQKPEGGWNRSNSQIFQQCAEYVLLNLVFESPIISEDEYKTVLNFLTKEYEALSQKEMPLAEVLREYKRTVHANF